MRSQLVSAREAPDLMEDFQEHGLRASYNAPPSGARRQTMRFGTHMLGMTTILFAAYGIALKDAHPQPAADTGATPLILEKNEGEHRVRRPRETPVPTGPFTIKIDRKNGASQKMFVGTEEIPVGGIIPRHKHLGQDEILLIQTGSAHVWLGTKERDVHAGAIVFIPSDTWFSLKNTGSEINH